MTRIVEKTADVVLALPPEPSSARLARHALHEARIPDDLEHTVDLLATELVSNAVRHAGLSPGDRILFAARFVEDHIRVEVGSPGPAFDKERALRSSGYGLRMVDKLASDWGIEPGVTGCRVWFEIDRRSRRRFPRG